MSKTLKRLAALVTLVLLCADSSFSLSIASIAEGRFKQLDLPLIDGIAYFQKSIGDFYGIAMSLANLLGVVCILWNVFRLWMGTQEVKKACTDIISKFLLFIFLINVYPLLIHFVADTAVNIGMRAGGGYNKVNAAFFALREDCEAKVEAARETLYQIIREGKDGGAMFSGAVKYMAQVTYIPEDELESFLKDKGVQVVTQDDYDRLAKGWWNKIFPTKEQRQVNKKIDEFVNSINVEAALELDRDVELQNAIITMKAMEEVLVKVDIENPDRPGASKVSRYLYNPFMLDEGGRQTGMLSPGAMIKTAVLISDIISRQGGMEYSSEKKGFIERKLDQTFQRVISLILTILMTFGLILASIFCVIQYVMCIFEYFIVTAVGVIFIPFCLWDGTKNFAAKLVTLFTSFFIKIMVMILCLFWVYSAFIHMGVSIMSSNEPISFLSFAYFIFTCLLGWVVTQNGPQIAVTILNGSPQLSMGEFLHAAGTAAAGAVMAKRAAAAGTAAAKTAGKGVQAAARGIQTIDAAWQGSAAAVQAAVKTTGGNLTGAQRFGIGIGALGSIINGGVKNTAATLLTGQEKKEGGISVGKGYSPENEAKDGSRMYHDAKEAAGGLGQRYGEQWALDRAPKSPEVPDKPTGVAGLKRD